MNKMIERSFTDLLEKIIDNRGRTCPTADSGLPLIATNCIKDDHLYPVFENVRYVDEETVGTWFRGHPRPNDIIFVCKGSPGRVAMVPDPVPFCIAQDMVALRADQRLIQPRYLYYALKSPAVQAKINNMHVGSMIPHFKKGDFGKLRFSIHEDIGEQQAIAEALGALDDKIAVNNKLVEVADELAASLTRRGLDISESVPLSSIADIVMGSSPSGSSFNEIGEGTVFYQGVRDFGVRFPSNRVWTTAPVRLATTGDTLLSVRAPVGRVNLATEETCIGRGVASVRSSTGRPFTLFHLLKNSDEAWAPFEAEGTVFGSINKSQLASLRVPGLRPELEGQLEEALAPIERAIASALGENDNLAATRDALLPQLMSDKLRVKDARKVLENAVA